MKLDDWKSSLQKGRAYFHLDIQNLYICSQRICAKGLINSVIPGGLNVICLSIFSNFLLHYFFNING